MLRKINALSIALASLFIFLNAVPVHAEIETLVKGAPAQVNPYRPVASSAQNVTSEDLLIVRDVIVDKTAENVIVARETAMRDARRQAFMKLAERNMPPEEFKKFKAPEDKTLSVLVHDFEINNEKLSTTRYVASFTVRFRDAVRTYINIVQPLRAQSEVTTDVAPDPSDIVAVHAPAEKTAAVIASAGKQTFLMLPYFERPDGKTILWEDPNPWRVVWQKDTHLVSGSGISFVVPIGDISDIAAGETNAVWSGDYNAIETLSRTYGTEQAVLSVASKSGAYMTVDMYFFKGGRLTKREVLQPFVGDKTEEEALHQAMREVVRFLQKPASLPETSDTVSDISRSLVGQTTSTTVETTTTTTTMMNGMAFEAAARFDSPNTWMDMQRRLSSLSPALKVDIRSISSTDAQFTMRYDGDARMLREVLLQKGIMMEAPSTEANPSVIVSGVPAEKRIYGLHLTN